MPAPHQGVVATEFSPATSVISEGVLCIAGVGAIALLVPGFARWRVRDPA